MRKGFFRLFVTGLVAVLIGVMAVPPAMFASPRQVRVERVEAWGGSLYAYTDRGVVGFIKVANGFSIGGFQIVVRDLKSPDANTRRIELVVGYPWREVASEFVWENGQFVGASNVEALGAALGAFRASASGAVLAQVGNAISLPLPETSCFGCILAIIAASAAVALFCTPPGVVAGQCAQAVAAYWAIVATCAGACCPETPGQSTDYQDPGLCGGG
jgi:hypothetical protein